MHIDAAVYQRTLGDELRKVRKERGWTRKDLQGHLHHEVSLQTLATYELGTRQCSVVRLAELCLALGLPPHELLERVHRKIFAESPPGRILVSLSAVTASEAPELAPFRRWAAGRLVENGGSAIRDVALDAAALERLAELCGLSTVDLIRRLQALS
ncbi:MAG: helix-turn-helix domain-containing protein [Sciscionella sp.]